jgi:transcriptional regulator with XRE-family HTH domain
MTTIAQKPENRLRATRLEAGVSQATLAQKSGLSESTVARIDQNEGVKISLRQAAAIAKALGCQLEALLP